MRLIYSLQLLVLHAAEVFYVYGLPPDGPGPEELSRLVIDYWVSFATSLDPNDGLGSQRMSLVDSFS